MPHTQAELDAELRSILGSDFTYYQPPENLRMHYPCIRYDLSDIHSRSANNKNYILTPRYDLTVIDKDPESTIYLEIMKHFSMCSFSRHYEADNLHHYVLTLFY